ncbi:MAG: branched-chain amino acid ABC transporter substrate-binding protein [Hyphomicrobium sp.]
MTRHPKTSRDKSASLTEPALCNIRSAAARTALLAGIMCLVQSVRAEDHRSEGAFQSQGVKIAVAGPLTGPYAAATEAIALGARAAAALLSKSESVPYEVFVKDDACDAAKAEEVATAIVAEDFDLVLGHPCPKAALAATKVYAAADVTFIATETRHPDLTLKRAGPSIFRLSGRDDAQGLDAARYLADSFTGKTIAIVHDRTLFAKTIGEQAVAALKAKKIEVIAATIVAGEKEYGKLTAKIKDADAVFFAGFPLEAGFIMKSLRAAGSKATLLATDSVATAEFTSSFPEIAKESFVLLLAHWLGDIERTTAATTAVRLFARARKDAMGPFRDSTSRRAAINVALLNDRDPRAGLHFDDGGMLRGIGEDTIKDSHEIVFDAAGNANVVSYRLNKWDGSSWVPASALR